MSPQPGGRLASRPLHFIWIADCSGSMNVDGRIQALNNAIREALPAMRQVAADNPNAEVLVRAVRFANGARWHLAEPTSVDEFQWVDLTADGATDTGAGLALVAAALQPEVMGGRALPPVLVLVTDGEPTNQEEFRAGLDRLMALGWGMKAVRLGVAIGSDANHESLREFIGRDEVPVLQASTAEQLTSYIRWASTVVLQHASAPASQTDQDTGQFPIPQLGEQTTEAEADVPTWGEPAAGDPGAPDEALDDGEALADPAPEDDPDDQAFDFFGPTDDDEESPAGGSSNSEEIW